MAERIGVAVLLSPKDKRRLDKICGQGALAKRQDWVREAILEKLAREEHAKKVTA